MPAFLLPTAGILLGLIIGSFLATLIVRWPEGRSVIAGRSACDHCGHQLRARELIPVVSFVFQSGRCSQCAAPIAHDHLAIELAAGLIGGLALFVAPNAEGLAGAVFGWLLLTLGALDVKHHWLPDRLTLILAISGLLACFFLSPTMLLDRIVGGLTGFGALALVGIVYKLARGRDGIGGGDPKMLGGIGCWMGWTALPMVIVAASLAGLLIVSLSWLRGKSVTGDTILPLGSLMALAGFPLWLYLTASGGLPY